MPKLYLPYLHYLCSFSQLVIRLEGMKYMFKNRVSFMVWNEVAQTRNCVLTAIVTSVSHYFCSGRLMMKMKCFMEKRKSHFLKHLLSQNQAVVLQRWQVVRCLGEFFVSPLSLFSGVIYSLRLHIFDFVTFSYINNYGPQGCYSALLQRGGHVIMFLLGSYSLFLIWCI